MTETSVQPHGKHLINGQWVASEIQFTSAPASGAAAQYSAGTPDLVNDAVEAAEQAFLTYG